jgi:SAM-dependent MidA family methyltransferase
MVDLDALGNLTFALGPPVPDDDRPSLIGHYTDGTIVEPAPDRAAFMQTICDRLIAGGGTFLTIDYGSLASGVGDTLQAVKNHGFDPPLANPGEADLTSHVDFEALADVARHAGLQVHGIQHQGDFLLGLGLLQRAGALGQGSSALTQDAIRIAVQRIAGEGAGNMGELFKVLAVSSPAIALTPFEVTDPH